MTAMDTELMKAAEDFASFDFLKSKNRFSPSFCTQETYSMIIISAQLKGYRRTDIKVERNEDGSRIVVSGEKLVQDMLAIGGKVVNKGIETQRFQKSFKILQGVVLDKVKVKFNDKDSKLVIQIPKLTKGFTGGAIEELKTEEIPPESTTILQVYGNRELAEQENQESEEENVQDLIKNDKQDKENSEEEQGEANHVGGKEDETQEPKSNRRRFKICKPIIFGSALFVSLIVMVFHLVQSEKLETQKKKKDQN
ncbi:Alpha crystallin/Hsp20 domain-containing protein [Cynara cardunculus var. scolymus]|uniref:Alpha crystallin/Hsp20 domain-containing protein n=2 Tax=Cynara cardunculus var. scolymus TaxID=59895 RepID=A0A103XZ99_CYNCS|nr:Alpha crystallin/Hsp20 domain-containing protein [Cynara cardunculus var. scolymus]